MPFYLYKCKFTVTKEISKNLFIKFFVDVLKVTGENSRIRIRIRIFGGLRMIECINLELEKINRGPEVYTITH